MEEKLLEELEKERLEQKKRDGFKGETMIVLPTETFSDYVKHPLVKRLYLTDVGACLTYGKQANAEHPEWKMTIVDPNAKVAKILNPYINGGMGININSSNKERAMMVINELYTNPKLQDLTTLGIEGKHWEAVGDDQYKIIDATGYPTDNNCNWGWTNQTIKRTEYIENRTELDGIHDSVLKSFDDNVKPAHPLDGFSFDTANVTTQCAAVEAACGTSSAPPHRLHGVPK